MQSTVAHVGMQTIAVCIHDYEVEMECNDTVMQAEDDS